MKCLIGLSLAVFSLGSFAQEDLSSMKQKANNHLDRKISSLQGAKNCVNNATTTDKFKACKYDMHEEMKMQKMETIEDKRKSLKSGNQDE